MYTLQFVDFWPNEESFGEFVTALYRVVSKSTGEFECTVTHTVCEGLERSLDGHDCLYNGELVNWDEHDFDMD